MAESKRFYWAKIKEEFFKSDEAKIIKRQKNGFIYLCLFQELLLMSVNTDGWFITKAGDMTLPWTAETICEELICYDVDHIRAGLSLLRRVGLIYEIDGVLRISDFENFVGSETSEAARKRDYRNKKAEEAQKRLTSTNSSEQCSIATSEPCKTPASDETNADVIGPLQKNDTDSNEPNGPKNSENSDNKDQSPSVEKPQKPLKGGFYNKTLKKLYDCYESQVRFYSTDKNLLDTLKRSCQSSYYNSQLNERLLGVVREIARHESYNINSSLISSIDLIKFLYRLLTPDGELIYRAFQKLDKVFEKVEVKNALLYTITFLYNESYGCSQKGSINN